mgnify:CR=1 FL=1
MSRCLNSEEKLFRQFVSSHKSRGIRFKSEEAARKAFKEQLESTENLKAGREIEKKEITQFCKECGEELELEFFPYSRVHKKGVSKICESCVSNEKKYLTPEQKKKKLLETKPKIMNLKKNGLNYQEIVGTLGISLSFYYQALKA